jgi:hypothetical protein
MPAADGEAAAPGTAQPVQLTMLGPLQITAVGQEIGGGLRKARELMAFLAVHPDGPAVRRSTRPCGRNSTPAHATGQRNLALRKARDMLRTATGLAAPMWILILGPLPPRPRPDQHRPVAVLRRPRRGRHAGGDDARLAACREAAGLYHGELAEGAGYEWAEPYAETARRGALDAWTTIAAILQARDPDQALAALESALGHDPYNGFLYQRIMRLQAAACRPEAVRRTLSLLEARLTELGVTPGAPDPAGRRVAARHRPGPAPPVGSGNQ